MGEVEHLKQQALHCRSLARSVGDERARQALQDTADEYEVRAAKLEHRLRYRLLGDRTQGRPPSTHIGR